MSNKSNSLLTKPDVAVEDNNNNNNNNSTENESQEPQLWSGLPDDVLRLIFEKLNWVDRVRLSAVSKNFFPSLLREIHRPIDNFPWAMAFSCRNIDNNGGILFEFELSDPSSKRIYEFQAMHQTEKARKLLYGARICSSNHGWLLLLGQTITPKYGTYHYFYLYAPFGNKFFELPGFGCNDTCYERDKVAFSVDPNSVGCVFNVSLDKPRQRVYIGMCHIGEQNWKNMRFYLPGKVTGVEVQVLEAVAYADRLVYCVFYAGRGLGIFDVVLQEWKFFQDCMSKSNGTFPDSDIYHLVAFNGDMFLYGNLRGTLWGNLCRLDKSVKQWVLQESLGDLAMFSMSTSIMLVEAVGELSSYANTIHHLSGSTIKYKSSYNSRMRSSPLYQCLDHCESTREYCWIQPSLLA